MEVNSISGHADGKVGVCLRILVCLHESLAVQHVYVDVVRLLLELSVKDCDEIGTSLLIITAESIGSD